MFVVGRDTLRSFHISESDGKVKVDEIRKYTQSKFLITSMACNETSIIMRVFKMRRGYAFVIQGKVIQK
jgi:hypothetical protein